MNHDMDDLFDYGDRVPIVPLERDQSYGGVPGLPDEELADPAELERQAFVADWGPILSLPVKSADSGIRPEIDEDGLPLPGVENGVRRNGDGGRKREEKLDVHEHVGTEHVLRIIQLEAHLQGTRGGVKLGGYLRYGGIKTCPAMRKRDLCTHSGLDVLRFTLEDVRHDPHAAQVSDAVPLDAPLELLVG